MLELVVSKSWYALQIHTQAAEPIIEALKWLGIEAFHPTFKQDSRSRYRPAFEKPLFPGYVFCRLDLRNLDKRHQVISIPGVVRIVGYGDQPLAIADQDIASIRLMVFSQAKIQPVPAVSQGETVVVKQGPLAGMEGVVVLIKGAKRIVVSVGLLNRGCSVEVDSAWLESVKQTALPKAA